MPILSLPPVETKVVTVEFSEPERQFYNALYDRSLSVFEGFIKAGTAAKSWLAIFSLLHRLRQACDHVALTVKSRLNEIENDASLSATKEAGYAENNPANKESTMISGALDENVEVESVGDQVRL